LRLCVAGTPAAAKAIHEPRVGLTVSWDLRRRPGRVGIVAPSRQQGRPRPSVNLALLFRIGALVPARASPALQDSPELPYHRERAPPKNGEASAMSDPVTCVDCAAKAPQTNTQHTLISNSFGWRLSRRVQPGGTTTLEWRCPSCWRKHKTVLERAPGQKVGKRAQVSPKSDSPALRSSWPPPGGNA